MYTYVYRYVCVCVYMKICMNVRVLVSDNLLAGRTPGVADAGGAARPRGCAPEGGHIYVYTNIYVHIMYIYVLNICIYIIYVCMYIYYIYIHVCKHICVCVCVCTCMFVTRFFGRSNT